MDSSFNSVNIDDYEILGDISLGAIPMRNNYKCHCLRAIDKKRQKEVAINIYEDYFEIEGKIDDIIPKPKLFELQGTVKVIINLKR